MSNNLKPTKRKAFNFLRSYFDVLNELNNDADKLDFLLSIINKQFLDEDPKGLNFIVNLCYESQRHAVESSVKGWKRVNGCDPTTNPPLNPTLDPKEEEEEEEEEVKGEGKEEEKVEVPVLDFWPSFDDFWDLYDKKTDRPKCEKKWKKISQGAREKIMEHLELYVRSTPDKQYRKHPATYLNNESWTNEIIIPTNGITKKQQQNIELVTGFAQRVVQRAQEDGL